MFKKIGATENMSIYEMMDIFPDYTILYLEQHLDNPDNFYGQIIAISDMEGIGELRKLQLECINAGKQACMCGPLNSGGSVNIIHKGVFDFTADDLAKMDEKELEELIRRMPKFEPPSDEILATMNVGIYDEKGNLIGIREGDDY